MPTPDDSCNDALSKGFDAGNYAAAYSSRDLEFSYGNNQSDAKRERPGTFRAAFVLGFFSSFEEREIPERYLVEYRTARDRWSTRMRELGIAVD